MPFYIGSREPTKIIRVEREEGTSPLDLLKTFLTTYQATSSVMKDIEERKAKQQAEAIYNLRNVLMYEQTPNTSILYREELIPDIAKALKLPEKYVRAKIEEAKKQPPIAGVDGVISGIPSRQGIQQDLDIRLKSVLGITHLPGLPYPIPVETATHPSFASAVYKEQTITPYDIARMEYMRGLLELREKGLELKKEELNLETQSKLNKLPEEMTKFILQQADNQLKMSMQQDPVFAIQYNTLPEDKKKEIKNKIVNNLLEQYKDVLEQLKTGKTKDEEKTKINLKKSLTKPTEEKKEEIKNKPVITIPGQSLYEPYGK